MVNCAALARSKLEAPDVTAQLAGNRDHERTKNVRTVRLQYIGLRHGHNEVGFSQPPASSPSRQRRKVPRVALDEATVHPLSNEPNLFISQSAFIRELSVLRPGFPRRHVTACGCEHDLGCVPAYI